MLDLFLKIAVSYKPNLQVTTFLVGSTPQPRVTVKPNLEKTQIEFSPSLATSLGKDRVIFSGKQSLDAATTMLHDFIKMQLPTVKKTIKFKLVEIEKTWNLVGYYALSTDAELERYLDHYKPDADKR